MRKLLKNKDPVIIAIDDFSIKLELTTCFIYVERNQELTDGSIIIKKVVIVG